eukprot:1776588-Pleurochrysis_carterae.AAC.1
MHKQRTPGYADTVSKLRQDDDDDQNTKSHMNKWPDRQEAGRWQGRGSSQKGPGREERKKTAVQENKQLSTG